MAARKVASLKPKFQTSKRKKLSSALALEIFKNWHTQDMTLFFVSFEIADFVPNCEARIVSVSPLKVELEGEGQRVSFDPRKASFWSLSAEDIPLRNIDLAPFVRFLGIRLEGEGRYCLLAERASVQ